MACTSNVKAEKYLDRAIKTCDSVILIYRCRDMNKCIDVVERLC